jgi:flagellar FliL protein
VAKPQTSSSSTKDNAASKSSMGQTLIALIAVTVIGGGGGGYLGTTLGQAPSGRAGEPPNEKSSEADGQKGANEKHESLAVGHGAHGSGAVAGDDGRTQQLVQVKELPPIVTNLAVPETSWVRLQASIVYDAKAVPHPELLVTELMSDLVAFLRTVTLASIEGADGLRRLHEDLSERVSIRSEGRVRQFIIQALVVQ